MDFHSKFRKLCCTLSLIILFGCSQQEIGARADTDSPPSGGPETANTADDAHQGRANRLARETSPYLLLHAHNPVDWYPWGPEAFETAKREKKPIFLSVGYSSCYWCHVMERLVFSDADIAKYMNEHFINIKVDREERPDVDDIYMTSLMIYFQLSGSSQGGGWPLSMFLTPEGKPIAGGTYFPPQDEGGRIGFPTVMEKIADLWTTQRPVIEQNADIITQNVRLSMKPQVSLTSVPASRELVASVVAELQKSYDPKFGGLDFNPENPDAPKFPVPAKLALLQHEVRKHADEEAGKIVYHTLDNLAAGGIHDHLGGGFHRYSTDREWQVPHFEKMLYDNAQLADVYVEAYLRTNKPLYRETAEDIFTFVLRDMTGSQGGFYSALDAETDTVEGKYYVWSAAEIEEILGTRDAELFSGIYGVLLPQTFEHGYILHLPKPLSELAQDLKMSRNELLVRLNGMKQKLLAARQKRKSPLLDDKILTSWNGLMIRALANGGVAFGRRDYVEAAEKAALFILSELRDEDGQLLRTYRLKTAKLNAYLDDYAFLVEGLLALHHATGDTKWLRAARRLTDSQMEAFWDEKGKGFFFTAHHHEELLARTKNAYDAVLPAGNSVSARNLVRLAALSGEDKYREAARDILELFAPRLEENPRSLTNMALAMDEYLDPAEFVPSEPIDTSSFFRPSTEPTSGRTQLLLTSTESSPGQRVQPAVNAVSGVDTVVASDDQEQPAKPRKKPELVTAKAYLSVDRLPAGGTCEVIVFVKIQDGWHINTNPAKPDFLVPTELKIKSKHAIKLTRVSYPAGKKLQVDGFDEPLHVYEKQLAIRGTLSIPATAAGQTDQLDIVVKYQACNDQRCLSPTTFSLKGRLAVAPVGETVKSINRKLFQPPKKRKSADME